ncbi:trypsin-like peptidase domain-containing protein [Roseomonas sp. AR75]|uniref:trypsin-like peptidase domain-containing protein n=1 Tax=Roseomonas sp. AR75 TaxID=2562311 RepID=UPI0010C07976|nr:trypsin-like peptidase domain-containing protein [Roseomonas sp. AR75]
MDRPATGPSFGAGFNRARAALFGVLMGTTALTGLAFYATPAPAEAPAVAAQATLPNGAPAAGFAALVKQVRPAVVTVTVSGMPARGPMGQPMPGRSSQAVGSGFIVEADGFIVTNNHVVDGAQRVTVTLDDGRRLPANIVGRDPRTDVALLKVEAGAPLPFVRMGDSAKAEPGDWVVAMGNPFGLGGTVTTGVVSAVGRDIGAGPYDDFIQVDAPINQGNSGGPLFSQDGRVIGMNTAIFSPSGGSVGIGFAVPSNLMQRIVADLKATGRVERGFVGVATQGVDAAMAKALRMPEAEDRGNTRGALVSNVEKDSPAAKAGLRAGDVVTEVDGRAVTSPRDLARAIADQRPGSKSALKVWRDGEMRTVSVEIGTQPGAQVASRQGGAEAEQPRIGVALAPITPESRRALNLAEDAKGAVVAQVMPDSPAAKAGLRAGDVIVGVGTTETADAEATVKAIREAASNDAVALQVLRNGTRSFVAVPLKQA